MKSNPVVWFEIYVQDLARAKAFYETVFACRLEKLNPPDSEATGLQMLAFPMETSATGAAGALVKMEGAPSQTGTLVYFACDDCAVEQARVAAAGGKVFKPKFSIGEYGRCALVYDTEGNMIGLHSMK